VEPPIQFVGDGSSRGSRGRPGRDRAAPVPRIRRGERHLAARRSPGAIREAAAGSAEYFGREVILNSNTLEDSIDQYDSMVKETSLADPNRRDPRYLNVFPSSEMAPWRRQWPVVPTFVYGGINTGVVERPT